MQVEEEEWLQHVLIEHERKNQIFKVISLDYTNAVPKGDNYGSDMFRIKLKVVTNGGEVFDRSLIYKAMPKTEFRRDGSKKSGLFVKEKRMYTEVLPEMERILMSKGKAEEKFWPVCYGVKRRAEGYLLEDLNTLGFKMEDKSKGMDFEHGTLVVKHLAKFHALAAIGVERADITVTDFDSYYLASAKEIIETIFKKSLNDLANTLEHKWKGEWVDYGKSLRKFAENFSESLKESFVRDQTKFNTLNHGDCWLNNVMFSCNENGEPENVRFMDFQLVHYNSPGFDLQYFFNTSLDLDATCRKEELLKIYNSYLVSYLESFGYNGRLPTTEEINDGYKRASMFGLLASLVFRPIALQPTESIPDLEELSKGYMESESLCMTTYDYDGEIFVKTIKQNLIFGRQSGFL